MVHISFDLRFLENALLCIYFSNQPSQEVVLKMSYDPSFKPDAFVEITAGMHKGSRAFLISHNGGNSESNPQWKVNKILPNGGFKTLSVVQSRLKLVKVEDAEEDAEEDARDITEMFKTLSVTYRAKLLDNLQTVHKELEDSLDLPDGQNKDEQPALYKPLPVPPAIPITQISGEKSDTK